MAKAKASTVLPEYLHTLPGDSVLALISILRNNEWVSRASEAAKHFHLLESYVFYITFGEPGTGHVAMAIGPEERDKFESLNDEDRLKRIEDLAVLPAGTEPALNGLTLLLLQWLLDRAVDYVRDRFLT